MIGKDFLNWGAGDLTLGNLNEYAKITRAERFTESLCNAVRRPLETKPLSIWTGHISERAHSATDKSRMVPI